MRKDKNFDKKRKNSRRNAFSKTHFFYDEIFYKRGGSENNDEK